MGNTECRLAVDEDEAERAFRWPAESGGAASVLSRSRGLQPFIMQELDLSARARLDPGNPTMAAAATRLQARAVTRAFSTRNEYSLFRALFALSLESQCACRNYLAKLMWHRALIAASARAERKARAYKKGACFPLALTSESLVRCCSAQALIAWERQKNNGVRKLSRLSVRRARKRGGVPIIEVGVASMPSRLSQLAHSRSRSPLHAQRRIS